MKSFLVYSGKGGVGKTTTSANIAKTLASQGEKVFVIDADINTPSMGVIFGSEHPAETLWVASTSFMYKNLIYMEKSMVRKFLRDCIKRIEQIKPDYVIIDTPPSITDVHINLLEVMKVSAIVIVTQPNDLSRTDVNRTASFFTEKCPDAGCIVIENMCKDEAKAEYNWPCVEQIPFVEGFKGAEAFTLHKDKYLNIVDYIAAMNPADVKLEAQKRELFNETITVDDLPYWDGEGLLARGTKKSEIKFINVSTWDEIRDRLMDMEMAFGFPDKRLEETTPERIERMIEPFKVDEEAYFMITNCPNTEIDIIVGEIGRASLFIADSYYGIPRIKYHTKQGDVVLFPNEVKPASEEDIRIALEDGSSITPDGRYIPAKWVLDEIADAFGHRVGLLDGWEKLYERITTGVIGKNVRAVESVIKNRAEERQRTQREYKRIEYLAIAEISNGESKWEEDFRVTTDDYDDAKGQVQEVIDKFNRSLKTGERERTLFLLKEVKKKKK